MNQQQQDAIEYLREENRFPRELLGSRRLLLNDRQRLRLATKAKQVSRRLLATIATIVTPEMLPAWHRKLVAAKYDGSKLGVYRGGRKTAGRIQALVVKMAKENGDWGYMRILGALENQGHRVSRGTVANILERHGLEPAPERKHKTTWKEFLERHWASIVAADFFSIEVWTRRGLQRFLVLFVLDLSTRKVEVAGIGKAVNGLWMEQVGRNLTDAENGILRGKRYLIHERDPLFTADFLDLLQGAGVESAKLPPRSPNLNAYAERFVRTIKESCLDRMILFGEGALRKAVREFVTHCHRERNPQGLNNCPTVPLEKPTGTSGAIRRRQRLGGMLNDYYRQAA